MDRGDQILSINGKLHPKKLKTTDDAKQLLNSKLKLILLKYNNRKTIGIKNRFAIHIPSKGVNDKSFADFSPTILITWNKTKNKIAIKRGIPKPPFLIIEPKDEPIKNINKHVNANDNFLCHSILCFAIIICLYLISSLLELVIDFSILILLIATS